MEKKIPPIPPYKNLPDLRGMNRSAGTTYGRSLLSSYILLNQRKDPSHVLAIEARPSTFAVLSSHRDQESIQSRFKKTTVVRLLRMKLSWQTDVTA